ncbi:MAG: hypothetical protein BMS9Abin05_0012 [Rhodothermia bacterium]|nr:MAG: hypothetical protein BMS9Abin05_0012 [Rhodothermia bacterium]
MSKKNIFPFSIAVVLIGSLAFVSCDIVKSDDEGGDQIGQAEIAEFFLDNQNSAFVMMEGFSRLLLALSGTQAPGITLTPRASKGGVLVFDGDIGLDFDGNGTYEVHVIGDLTFPGTEPNLDNGATARITEVTGSSIDGTAVADVTASGPGGAFVSGTGTFQGASGPPVDLDFGASISLFQSSISGSADVVAGDLEATVFFEPAQFAPFQIRVVSDDFEFVVGADLFGKTE